MSPSSTTCGGRGGGELEPVDLIAGGFPCQPFSVAGKRTGKSDERYLWPEFARIVEELMPRWVLIENVPGLRTGALRDVLADLAALGFDAEWDCCGAVDVGAPHRRDRLFVAAANTGSVQLRDEPGWLRRAFRAACAPVPQNLAAFGVVANPDPVRRLESAVSVAEERGWVRHCGWRLGSIARVDDGVSRAVDRRRALGDAVVPRLAEIVGRAMREVMA
jgi:DNA (cytosine-5)-methyltransferase 1